MIEVINGHTYPIINGELGEYVGRGTPLGNPIPIEPGNPQRTRDAVCDAYEIIFAEWVNTNNPSKMAELNRLRLIYERDGILRLRCSCAPKRCHALTIKRWIEDNAFNNEASF